MEKLSSKTLLKLMSSCILIDTRHPELFAQQFIKNSINIPVEGDFRGWARSILPGEAPVILIVDYEEYVAEIAKQLSYIGNYPVLGFVVWDKNLEVPMGSFDLCTVKMLNAESDDYFIIDVRTLAEWNMGHIPSAHHIELGTLEKRLNEIPKDKKIATVCGAGFRSSLAASILERQGYTNVASTQGGMRAWNSAALPLSE